MSTYIRRRSTEAWLTKRMYPHNETAIQNNLNRFHNVGTLGENINVFKRITCAMKPPKDVDTITIDFRCNDHRFITSLECYKFLSPPLSHLVSIVDGGDETSINQIEIIDIMVQIYNIPHDIIQCIVKQYNELNNVCLQRKLLETDVFSIPLPAVILQNKQTNYRIPIVNIGMLPFLYTEHVEEVKNNRYIFNPDRLSMYSVTLDDIGEYDENLSIQGTPQEIDRTEVNECDRMVTIHIEFNSKKINTLITFMNYMQSNTDPRTRMNINTLNSNVLRLLTTVPYLPHDYAHYALMRMIFPFYNNTTKELGDISDLAILIMYGGIADGISTDQKSIMLKNFPLATTLTSGTGVLEVMTTAAVVNCKENTNSSHLQLALGC